MPGRYSIPKVLDSVDRPRLFQVLNNSRDARVFLIVGQAAQGKSTLVASYLKQSGQNSVWCHLNQEASDHTRLFDILLEGVGEQLGKSGKNLPDIHLPQATLGAREDLLRQVDVLTMVFAGLNEPLNLVLDDLESLDSAGSSFLLLEHLVRQTFGPVRFFLLSRTQLPLPFLQLKAENQVMALGNQDLAFTRKEISLFFDLQAGEKQHLSGLGAKEIEKIFKITEGWAGGLVLISESLRRFQDITQLPVQMSSAAMPYFSTQIYQDLPEQIREFLMKTAIFNLLDTRVLKRFFPDQDTLAILEKLEQRNLFIQKIDSHPSWPVYKYNHLFLDFLKQDLDKTLEHQTVVHLNQRAGHIFWDMKFHREAAFHFIKAKDFDMLARIIRIKGTDYIITGKAASLAKWMDELPREMVWEDSWLLFYKTMTLRIKGGKENIRRFSRAMGLFEEENDLRGMILATAFMIEASVFIRRSSREILNWIQSGENLLKQPRKGLRLTWARTILWQHIGLGYIAGTGDIPKGVSACQNALLLARSIENPDLVLNASVVMTLGLVRSGDFVRAKKMLERLQNITGENRHPEYRALKHMVDIDYALKQGRLRRAKRLLELFEADIDKFNLIFLYPESVEARACYYTAKGEFDQALMASNHLSDFSVLEGNDFYQGICLRMKAMVYLLQENYLEARDHARMAVTELSRSGRGDIHFFLARQVLGAALVFTRDLEGASKELEHCLAYFHAISSDLFFCETAFLAGLGAWKSKDENRAKYFLDQGFNRAKAKEYLYFPLITPKIMAKILVVAGRTGASRDGMTYMTRLMSKRGSVHHLRQALQDTVKAMKPKNKMMMIDRLRPFYRMSLARIRIQTLGEFKVFIDTTPVHGSAFGGTKPKALLKIMVLNGSRDITKERLIDDLWPDSTARAGEKNFKTTLHRLRKALEPNPIKAFGYSYLVQKAGLVSLDPELVRVDIDDFDRWVTRAEDLERENKIPQALEWYDRVVGLYQGDYFAEDPYLDRAARPRNRLRTKYLRVLAGKARLHEEIDQWGSAVEAWQSALFVDPFFEPAYRNLMILFADAGQKKEALDLYEQCRIALKKGLDAEPDPKTRGIHGRIQAL